MKYDSKVFELSLESYNMSRLPNDSIDEETKKKQDKLFKIILEKFKEELELKKKIGKGIQDGILKVKFESPVWEDSDLGYYELHELVLSGNFDSFASEYCMYLGNTEWGNDWKNAYYEVIWDYKTYFEQLKNTKSGKKVISDWKKEDRKNKRDFCKISGHNFGEWQRDKKISRWYPKGPETIEFGVGPIETPIPIWKRKCIHCGYVQTVSKMPEEVEAVKIEEEIKKLQKKLDTMNKK